MITTLKKSFPLATFMAAILLTTACDDNKMQEDSKEVAEERNDAVLIENEQEKDAQFLVNAAEMNLEDIELAKLAQQKGTSASVKQLGKMMEDAHTKSQNELIALAQNKGIAIPNSTTNDALDAYSKLNEKSGEDFDKAYADRMVSGHKDAISAFEDATTKSNDPDIKNWAIATLPVLRTHLNHAMESKDLLDKR